MSVEQVTLAGETTDAEREKPSTWVYCGQCDEWMLRSQRHAHEHETHDDPEAFAESLVEEGPGSLPDEDDHEDVTVPEKVGAWYEITLSYSVDYRFRIPATSEKVAEERAEDLKIDARPSSSHQVHTRRQELEAIEPDDMPDDWEPPLGAPLWEVMGDD